MTPVYDLDPTRLAAVELARVCGQLLGRLSWIGQDFTKAILDRLDQLQALSRVDPNAPAVRQLISMLDGLTSGLREMVELVGDASEGFDDMIAHAKGEVLAALPRSN